MASTQRKRGRPCLTEDEKARREEFKLQEKRRSEAKQQSNRLRNIDTNI